MRMRFAGKAAAFMLAIALLLGCMNVQAADYPFVAYTTNSLRLRATPSDQAAVLCTIPAGEGVVVTGQSGNYYIATYYGIQGYAMKTYLSLSLPSGSASSSQPYQPAAPTPEDTDYTPLYSGMQGDQVSALQSALRELGFYSGSVDGKFGAGTKSAVNAFQQKNQLAQTGTASAETQRKLFEGTPLNSQGRAAAVKTAPFTQKAVVASGSIGPLVEKMQNRLKELGYYTGKVDGVCGSGMVSALKAFQQSLGVTQTGRADAALRTALFAQAAPDARSTAAPKATATPKTPATNAPAAAYPYTTYTLASVNLRKSNSVSSTRLATVPKGADITVQAAAGEFVQVVYNGKNGYVMAEYVYIPVQYLPGSTLNTDDEAQQNYASLQYGASGKNVKALQQALKELGFYTATVDSQYGIETVNAVKSFQNKNGLRQDGAASPEIQKLIFEGKPKNVKGVKTDVKTLPPIEGCDMRLNDQGDAVTQLQDTLRALGYFTGASTGVFSSATQTAVLKFQKDHSLTADGVVGAKTRRLLQLLTAESATPVPAPQPTVAPAGAAITAANVVVMRRGVSGVAVRNLQTRLKELGYYTAAVDGQVGTITINAVQAFQKRNGLKTDGIAGLETQLKLYSAAAVPAATAAPAAVPAVTPGPNLNEVLRIGSSGESVRTLQERLTVLGYFHSAVDGVFGTGTASAVTAFQQQNALTADGVAGSQTLKKLYGGSAVPYAKPTAAPTASPAQQPVSATLLRSGDRGTEVKKMQQRLVALGYLNAADGIFGAKTSQAVKEFQRRNGLTSDGIAGPMTLTRLNSSAAIAALGSTVAVIPDSNPAPSSSGTFRAPAASEVRNANWYTEIRDRARLMPDVVIYDPDTGLHYNLHMFSFGKHADAEPPTAADTATMNRIIGENNWTPKYVWVIFSDGRVYIASTHSHGHEVDHTANNNLTGHVCIHFPRVMSEAEATGPYAVSHQNEILYGWEVTKAMGNN